MDIDNEEWQTIDINDMEKLGVNSIVAKLIRKVSEMIPDILWKHDEFLRSVGFKPELGGTCSIEMCYPHRRGFIEIKPKGREHLVPKGMAIVVVFTWRVWFGRWLTVKVL